ncbi:DUF134 domain-containing protein [Proteiniborus sp.]|uniref:DUF134 domain-containing protein n=1 Tax=Proteiniborus sp. TaxID=2079015 RepID=UPI003319EE1A
MARPVKFRRVEFLPEDTYFIPWGKPKCEIQEIALNVEELEAMRLKDIEKLTQEECAEKMHISRQTFQNIIDSAREKVAIALTEGKAIRIGGGYYTTNHCKFRCMDCNSIYQVNFERDKNNCPNCGSKDVVCSKKTKSCRRWCREEGK